MSAWATVTLVIEDAGDLEEVRFLPAREAGLGYTTPARVQVHTAAGGVFLSPTAAAVLAERLQAALVEAAEVAR